jgi:hypothetical protein
MLPANKFMSGAGSLAVVRLLTSGQPEMRFPVCGFQQTTVLVNSSHVQDDFTGLVIGQIHLAFKFLKGGGGQLASIILVLIRKHKGKNDEVSTCRHLKHLNRNKKGNRGDPIVSKRFKSWFMLKSYGRRLRYSTH